MIVLLTFASTSHLHSKPTLQDCHIYNMHALTCLLLFSLATAAVIPSITKDVPKNHCCFTLHDTKTDNIVQQDQNTGYMYLGADQPDAWFCLDLTDARDILLDDFNNACFLAPYGQLKCLDPTLGFQSWSLKRSGGNTLLTHDDLTAFKACPNDSDGRLVYGDKQTDFDTCQDIELEARGLKGSCGSFTSRSRG